jgi:hypothetical protein
MSTGVRVGGVTAGPLDIMDESIADESIMLEESEAIGASEDDISADIIEDSIDELES